MCLIKKTLSIHLQTKVQLRFLHFLYTTFLQLFDGLKESRGLDTLIKQCHVIAGDCSLPDLGVSEDDRELLAEKVSIVYHCAATVRFDEELKRAVLLNTRGTKLMLALSKTFKKLAVSEDHSDVI